ncbi:hypothetical protein LguiA_036441 [Lonicera macranthoides]
MKRSPSSSSLQFIAVAVAVAASTDTLPIIMSSRPPYRGNRNQWRRGYSSNRNRRDEYVTGDSHFRSDNHTQSRPPPPFNSRPSFDRNSPPPPQSFSHNQHQFRPPPFYHNQQHFRPSQQQQFRPRPPKPLDYRNWDYAKPAPPPHCERFTVLSYNILADYLAINHRSKLYFHIPRHILDWEYRKRSIIFELGLWSADILCFQLKPKPALRHCWRCQEAVKSSVRVEYLFHPAKSEEVDRFQDLEVELKVRGYNGIWKMRTGDPVDGCAVFWRVSRFKLLHEESIEFSKLGLRDNVAQICVFESMNQTQNHNRSASGIPGSAAGSNKVVICNIHVLYNPKRGEIKLGQSPLYTFISEQKLNLSELPRDKLSGQASAEIRPQRPFSTNFRGQSSDNSARAPTMVEDREVRQSNSPLDMQKQNGLDSNLENIPLISGLSEQISDRALSDEPKKEVRQGEDVCNSETELTQCVPVSDLNACTINSQSEVGSSVDQMKDEINEYSFTNSHQEDIYLIETGFSGYASNTSHVSSSEPFEDNLQAETESVKCENSMGYNYSTAIPTSNILEVSSQGISENWSSLSNENDCASTSYGADISYKSTSIDIVIDKKMEDLSLNESGEVTEENETLGEDSSTFLFELHNTNNSFPSEFSQFPRSDFVGCNDNEASNECNLSPQQLHSPEPFYVERPAYDPSAWTPMEIETATGSSECTLMEHTLKLRSTYSEVEDPSGTRDSNGEPLVTSYNRCFLGTVDYIWCSQGLQTVRVLAPIPTHAMQWTPGFPTKKWGSDHIALVSELAFTKYATLENAKVE